jgi:hypothetical protein
VDASGLGLGLVAGSCEHGNETSGFIKAENFLDNLSECQVLKKDSAACSLI